MFFERVAQKVWICSGYVSNKRPVSRNNIGRNLTVFVRTMTRIFTTQLRRLAIATMLCITLWTGLQVAANAEVPSQVTKLQSQVETLQEYVEGREWLEIRSFIHGPMGQVRRQLFFISQKLPKSMQASLEDEIEAVSANLNVMDEAAENYSEKRLVNAQKELAQAVEAIAASF